MTFESYDSGAGAGAGARSIGVDVSASPTSRCAAASGRAALEALDLPGTKDEFRQNYLLVTGALTRGPRGFRLDGVAASDWRRAGPEPATGGQGR